MMNDTGRQQGDANHSHRTSGQNLDTSPDASREISSDKLFAGHREILIKHQDKTYRLRMTNQGKLVLNL